VPLYCAFQVPETLDGVLGVEIVIDIQHSQAALPNWWRYEPGGCMEFKLSADVQSGGGVSCIDPWQGNATALVQDDILGAPGGSPSMARIKLVVAVPSAAAVVLLDSVVYTGARLLLPASELQCAGCDRAACLVLNSIVIRRLPGLPGGDAFLQVPAASNGNWAHWNGNATDCTAVPVTARSWGQIKALYR
jgi:hypothetical protein